MSTRMTAAALAVGLTASLGLVAQAASAPAATPIVAAAASPLPAPATPAVATALAAKAKVKIKTFKNCTALNKVYKHGVGKPGAKDKVKGKTKKVTNFYKNAALYNANKKSDRDKDGIACEKR